MDKTALPLVREYLDAYLFLQDVYASCKKLDPKFSYSVWARAMGLESKSYLRFSVLGQRSLSPDMVSRISTFLSLSALESGYFTMLVLFTQSQDPEQKKIYSRHLMSLLKKDIPFHKKDNFPAVGANPLALVIRNILSFSDIPKTVEFISAIVNLSLQETGEILTALQSENLVDTDGETWWATQERIKFTDKTNGGTLRYHKECLLKAIQSQVLPVDQRHYRSVGLAMTADEYKSYLEDLDAFIQNVFAKYDHSELNNRKVYQINFNLFPWTQTVSV